MKIVYLDQNHWIELSRAAHGRVSRTETPRLLDVLREAHTSERASFPLSLAHYMETLKHQNPDGRSRLATFMLELSGGRTVASSEVVARHEVEMALEHCFPGRVVPAPFSFLGRGLSHAAGRDLGFHVEWPSGTDEVPAPQQAQFGRLVLDMADHILLSGVLPTGDSIEPGPTRNLTQDLQFTKSLDEWRGVASRYSPDELERRIYATTLKDILDVLQTALTQHEIHMDEFALLGEPRWRAFLDDMPSRRADMHLRRQWAKNANPAPKDSDLNDWSYLGTAVSYCDIVVTEKQMADLLSRGFDTRATIVPQLRQLPELLTSPI
ncbi:hypothetical protein ACFLSF_00320 [Candidatus Bipolaricaulota bacterium]